MSPVIWHNPDCGTSGNVLHILQACGLDPRVVLYRETPPDKETLARTIFDTGMSVRNCLRRRGTPYDEMGLDDRSLSDDDLLDAMLREPILINRPFVRTDKGVALCRPAEVVFDLIDAAIPADLTRTDGAALTPDSRVGVDDSRLIDALVAEGLPVSDLASSGATFYAYTTPDGELAGFGGFEALGQDALIRSVVVTPERRGQGLLKAMVPLLLRRAFDAGARTAWLLTDTAPDAFEHLKFEQVSRNEAPEAVRETEEFALLCPDNATLMRKAIAL